jgi:ATP-dependent 26S proteasome regulatory subunit
MKRVRDLIKLLEEAGYDVDTPSHHHRLIMELDQIWTDAEGDPKTAIRKFLAERRKNEMTRDTLREVTNAVSQLEGLIGGLLGQRPLLCRFERTYRDDDDELVAVVRIAGQLRELAVHPEVDADGLEQLMPWHFVCVHPEEMVVIGYRNDPELFDRAHGDLVELLGWADESRGLVRVSHHGHEERIVALAPTLLGEELQPPARLVLQRDDDRWAIAAQSATRRESRFELDVSSIDTQLTDLAGLDDLKELLVEDFILRFLRPGVSARYGIRPMKGVILASHQPGQGKTALVRAYSAWAHEMGRRFDIDVVLYFVPPGALKTVWHGGDAKLVREDLCGAIRARQHAPRTRRLFQVIVLDEIDSLGKRVGKVTSSAQNDAVTALLSEMDGIVQWRDEPGQPTSEMLWIGMTNRVDLLDVAMTRPGRFDSVISIPPFDLSAAVDILAIHADADSWYVDGQLHAAPDQDLLKAAVLRPALRTVFEQPVVRYATESRTGLTVRAGRLMSGARYEAAANAAKRTAALREIRAEGVPGVSLEDVADALWSEALATARLMAEDPRVLARELEVPGSVARVELLGTDEPLAHRFLHPS